MKKYTYSNGIFGFFGQGNEKDTYSNGFFGIFGFGTPGELARQGGGASESSSGVPNPKKQKKTISLCVFVSFLTKHITKTIRICVFLKSTLILT